MKIEIDLDDILGDEFGAESLQESIKRQVIEKMTNTIQLGIASKIDEEISRQINTSVADAIKIQMPVIVDDVLNATYTPVTNYGHKGVETTFRTELIKGITEQMVYKKANPYGESPNVFSKVVDSFMAEQMKLIAEDYKKTCNSEIAKEAFNLAVKTLREKLGVTA